MCIYDARAILHPKRNREPAAVHAALRLPYFIGASAPTPLEFARTMLSNPKILILDEATSSIDTKTEQMVQAGIANILKGRTSFVVAHRLSTIRESDVILVMRDGNIVEQGSHDELLKKKGFYYELYNSQFAKPSLQIT